MVRKKMIEMFNYGKKLSEVGSGYIPDPTESGS
jgi:hypothetical protein